MQKVERSVQPAAAKKLTAWRAPMVHDVNTLSTQASDRSHTLA